MREWLRAVILNAPAVLLLAIVFSSTYLASQERDIPSLFYFLAAALAVSLRARNQTSSF